MNKIQKIISYFSLHLILCLIINFINVDSSTPSMKESSIIDEVYRKLAVNNREIQKLTQKLQFRSKSSSQSYNETFDNKLYKKLYNNLPPFKLQNLKQSGDSILFNQACRIQTLKENENNNQKINYHFVSSHNEYFIFINSQITGTLSVYDFNCSLLAKINNLSVKLIFQQEKSASKSGFGSNKQTAIQRQSIFAISSKNQLIEIDLTLIKNHYLQTKSVLKSSKRPQSTEQNFYRILNNKIVTAGSNQQIIGVLIKTINNQQSPRSKEEKNTPSYSQKSLIIAFDSSEIKIYDESGALKLTMKQPSPLDDLYQELNGRDPENKNSNEKSLQFINHHPYPILMENNWIYFIDTNKYTRHAWSCPYVPNVKKVFVENIHANQVYVLTEQKILKFNIKNKDHKKGHCELQRSIPYFDPYIKQKQKLYLKVRKLSQITFSVHKNLIFVDNLVYNMTSNLYLGIYPQNIMNENKIKQKEIQCNQISLEYVPFTPVALKKPSNQKHYTIFMLCKSSNSEYLQLYSITQIKPESSVFIYIIFAFLLLIFFAVKFFKSSGPSYEKELLYPMDLSAEQRQIRKEQYEQLHKYMDQAKKVQNENKIKKQPKQINQKSKKTQKEDKKKKQ